MRDNAIDLGSLREFTGQMANAVSVGDLDLYHALAARFHAAMVMAGGNKLLLDTYNRVKIRFRRYQAAMARIPDLPAQSMQEHEAILDAIERCMEDEARSLAESHISSLVMSPSR